VGPRGASAQGLEYPLRIAVYLLRCAFAARSGSVRLQLAFAVANLVYQVSWILRLYDVLD
jgi:hypothetical protein